MYDDSSLQLVYKNLSINHTDMQTFLLSNFHATKVSRVLSIKLNFINLLTNFNIKRIDEMRDT